MWYFYRHLHNYGWGFYCSLAALFVTAGLSLLFPWLMSDLIGSPVDAWQGGEKIEIEGLQSRANQTILFLLGALALQATLAYWRMRGFIWAGEGALNDVRRELFAKLVRLPVDFFEERGAGELSGRVAADLEVLRETLLTTVPQMVRQSVILLGGLIFIFVFSIKLSLMMLGMVPLVVLVIAFLGRRLRVFSRQAQDALAVSTTALEETAQGVKELKAYGNEQWELERYGRALDSYWVAICKGAKARAFFVGFIIFVLFGTIGIMAWFGAGMLVRGEIASREFTGFILFSVFVGASLGALPEIMSQLQKANGATERLREIIALDGEDLHEEEGASGQLSGEVKAQDLRFYYPSRPEVEVLKGVDFHIQPGQKVAFVGPSGAGKSTLFSLLLGFYDVTGGTLSFDGKIASDWSLLKRRGAMALVPQEVLLFGGTIEENIRYGRPDASKEEVEAAAKQASAHGFISEFPEGYETQVGSRGVKLSGGQRQRLAIARAILANPQILLLDEATSALDSESERLVQEALERLMQGRTSILIAHRLATVRNVDRIFVLQGGRIVESGRHEELLEKDGVYRVLAETQLL